MGERLERLYQLEDGLQRPQISHEELTPGYNVKLLDVATVTNFVGLDVLDEVDYLVNQPLELD